MVARTAFLALFAFATTISAGSARAEYVVSAYGGYNVSFDSQVDVRNAPSNRSFDVEWDGRTFEDGAPYYGLRGTWWLNDFAKPNWGVAIDFTHAKVAADPLPDDVEILEFTDGINLLTANILYRMDPTNGFTPYAGVGAGLSIPHVEYKEVGGPKTFEYQVTGPAVQALAGVDYAFTDHLSVFGEYKIAYSHNEADLKGGGSLETGIFTNQFVLGASFSFDVR